MTQEEIREQHSSLVSRLRVCEEQRRWVEAEIVALRHQCDHPNLKTWSDGNARMSTAYHICPDCGQGLNVQLVGYGKEV